MDLNCPRIDSSCASRTPVGSHHTKREKLLTRAIDGLFIPNPPTFKRANSTKVGQSERRIAFRMKISKISPSLEFSGRRGAS
jgi:hypothetical protein